MSPTLCDPLDAFGQSPRLDGLYTQLCYCFRLPGLSQQIQEDVATQLQNGLQQLSHSVPWISGQVTKDVDGLYKIRSLESAPRLLVKDLCAVLPTFDVMQEAGFPFSVLDEQIIASRTTLPTHSGEPKPAFEVQVNLLEGGVLVVFSAQHNCMDMRGQVQMIHLLAKACRGEHFTEEDLLAANAERTRIVPSLDPSECQTSSAAPASQFEHLTNQSEIREPSPTTFWSYFAFSGKALATFKTKAEEDMTTPFVSTDDVLSAFVWQAVTRARQCRLTGDHITTFDRQVNARKYLGISNEYSGVAVHRTSLKDTVNGLLSKPLGVVASQLRDLLRSSPKIGYEARAAAAKTMEAVYAGTSASVPARAALTSADIKMSSWAKEDSYDQDFGHLFGKPVAVRRPSFGAWEGLAYLLPKAPSGEILVAVCLREDDLERLKQDDDVVAFGEYLG